MLWVFGSEDGEEVGCSRLCTEVWCIGFSNLVGMCMAHNRQAMDISSDCVLGSVFAYSCFSAGEEGNRIRNMSR